MGQKLMASSMALVMVIGWAPMVFSEGGIDGIGDEVMVIDAAVPLEEMQQQGQADEAFLVNQRTILEQAGAPQPEPELVSMEAPLPVEPPPEWKVGDPPVITRADGLPPGGLVIIGSDGKVRPPDPPLVIVRPGDGKAPPANTVGNDSRIPGTRIPGTRTPGTRIPGTRIPRW